MGLRTSVEARCGAVLSPENWSAPGLPQGVELASTRDPPTFEPSLPNTSRASSPGRSSSFDHGVGEPKSSPIKCEEEIEVEVAQTELQDGLAITSSDHTLPVANLVCHVALNKGRRRILAKGFQQLNDHDTAF